MIFSVLSSLDNPLTEPAQVERSSRPGTVAIQAIEPEYRQLITAELLIRALRLELVH